jgi:hypothetical protein
MGLCDPSSIVCIALLLDGLLQEDVFEVEAPSLPGPLTHLLLALTPGGGSRPAWHCLSAIVTTLVPTPAAAGGTRSNGAGGWASCAVAYFWADRWAPCSPSNVVYRLHDCSSVHRLAA